MLQYLQVAVLALCPTTLALIKPILESVDPQVASFHIETSAQALMSKLAQADVVLISIDMYEPEQIAQLRCVAEKRPRIPILINSRDVPYTTLVLTMEFGLHGYISTAISPEDLILGLWVTHRQGVYCCPASRMILSRHYALGNLGLSERDTQLLKLIAAGENNQEIATVMGISPKTVDQTIKRLREKINAPNRTALATWWLRMVYYSDYVTRK
jgi:DNA-binding NarL/FixJ family response regulator